MMIGLEAFAIMVATILTINILIGAAEISGGKRFYQSSISFQHIFVTAVGWSVVFILQALR